MSLSIFSNYAKYVDTLLVNSKAEMRDIDLSELESVLVSHGVVLLYARMEQCFQELIERKCNHCTDEHVRKFALSVKEEKAGKLRLEYVKSLLKRFGIDHSSRLSPLLQQLGSPESWDSIVNVRQRIAHHGERATISLKDLDKYHQDVCCVLGCISKAMGLSESEAIAVCSEIKFPNELRLDCPAEAQ
jgi:hypothetical protein